MIKLGYGDGKVIVTLTTTEFKGLAGDSYSDVPDGTDVSLLHIKQKLDLVDTNQAALSQLKTLLTSVVNKLTDIGI